MPRIPTSKPQDVRSRPSVGGQVNLSSQDAFFRSIASASQEAGQLFEQARVEKQKLIDQKAINEQKINQRESLNNLNILLSDPEITSDKYGGVIDSWYEENQEFVTPVGISKTLAESLKQDHSGFLQIGRSNAEVATVEKLQREAFSSAKTMADIALEGQQWEDAISTMAPYQSPQQAEAYGKLVELKKSQYNKKAQQESAKAKLAMATDRTQVVAAVDEMFNSGLILSEDEKIRVTEERVSEIKLENYGKTKEKFFEEANLAAAENDDDKLNSLIEELQEVVDKDDPFVFRIKTILKKVDTAQANSYYSLARQAETGTLTKSDVDRAKELNFISENDAAKFDIISSGLRQEDINETIQKQIDNEDKDPDFKALRATLDKRLGEWFSGKFTNRSQIFAKKEIERFQNNINGLNITTRQKAILTSRLGELMAIANTNYNPDGYGMGGHSALQDDEKAEMNRLAQIYSKHGYPSANVFAKLSNIAYEEGVVFNSLTRMQETLDNVAAKIQKGDNTIDGKSFEEYVEQEAIFSMSIIWNASVKNTLSQEEQNNLDQN